MKLYVDDLRQPPEGWEVARTITDAIRILATGMVDEISLDHDIMIPEYGGKSSMAHAVVARLAEETFMPVAHYLAIMKNRPQVKFHSGNIAMAQRMAELIGCKFDYVYD